MKKAHRPISLFFTGMSIPLLAPAQSGTAGDIRGLQSVLDTIYDQMLPLCSSLIGVGRGLAGFAATWYIAIRVWRHIANAEPIDLFPLLRPFVLGFAVLIFPSVIALLNGVLQPTVTATRAMVQDQDLAIQTLLQQRQAAVENSDFWKMYVGPDGNGDRDKWYQYTHPDDPTGAGEGMLASIGNDIKFAMAKMSYNFRNSIKQWLSEILEILFEAASLAINSIRTFYLLILAILGPIVFGLSVFDGLRHTLSAWIARYINVFLWLPVANIFGSILGKIQQNMISMDINQIQSGGDTFFSATDSGYLIFLLIGIIGYACVPSVAGYIVQAGGAGTLLQRVNQTASQATQVTIQGAGAAASAAGSAASAGTAKIAGAITGEAAGFFGLRESASTTGERRPGGFSSNKI